jgi:hypothetical protein
MILNHQYMKLKRLLVIILLFPIVAVAQKTDITGLWKGTLFNDSTQKYYRYEIGISKEKKGYSGFSHTWFILSDTQYFGVKKIRVEIAGDGKIIVEDNGLIAHNYPIAPAKGVRQLNILDLDAADSIMTMRGPFTTNRTKEFHSLTGTIILQRRNDFWRSSLVPHLQELGIEDGLSFVREEKLSVARKESVQVQSLARKQQEQKDVIAKQEKQKLAEEKEKLLLTQKEELKKIKDVKAREKQEKELKEAADKALAKQEKADKEQQRQNALRLEREEKDRAKIARLELEQEKQAAIAQERVQKLIAKQESAKQVADQKATVKKEPEKPATPINTSYNATPAADFSSDSLMLSLYDNGEIDGDTVSVLLNGQVILAKQGLNARANNKTIYIPANTSEVELIMYAESLGSIPPNTGLLVVRDGKEMYELRFSGDYQKNASILFRRKLKTP